MRISTIWAGDTARPPQGELEIEWDREGGPHLIRAAAQAGREEIGEALRKGKNKGVIWIARKAHRPHEPLPDTIRIEDPSGRGTQWTGRDDATRTTQALARGRCYSSQGRQGGGEHVLVTGACAPRATTRRTRASGWLNPIVTDTEWTGKEAPAHNQAKVEPAQGAEAARPSAMTLLDIMVLDEGGEAPEPAKRALEYAELSARNAHRTPASALVLEPTQDPGADACLAFTLLDALGGTFLIDLGEGGPRTWIEPPRAEERAAQEDAREELHRAIVEGCIERLALARATEGTAPMHAVPTLDVQTGREGERGRNATTGPIVPRSRVLIRMPEAPAQCDWETRERWENERARFAIELTRERWRAALNEQSPAAQDETPWDPWGSYWGDALLYAALARCADRTTPVGGWESRRFILGESKTGGRATLTRRGAPARICTPAKIRIVTAR